MRPEEFLTTVQDSQLFSQHKKVLLALSGGHDSMNLFHLLYRYRKEFNIELGLAHVNHKQRPEADTEEDYLRDMAKDRHLSFYSTAFQGVFSENKAREFRYHFFAQIMKDQGYTALVTAHHQDDQVETIFMKILRGSRLRHLAGIQLRQPFAGGELIRPLLFVAKADLADCFAFEDASNAQPLYLRNRIRNHYLPLLREENPQLGQALLTLAEESQHVFQAIRELTAGMDCQNLSFFQQQTASIQYVLLQDYLAGFPDLALSRQQFAEVLHILRGATAYYHELKAGYFLRKDHQRFELTKIGPKVDTDQSPLVIQSNGIYTKGEFIFSLGEPVEFPYQALLVKKDTPISIRARRPGDTLLVNGLHKKLR